MGAYYEASLLGNEGHKKIYGDKVKVGEMFRVNTHDIKTKDGWGNGLKLMEHSYVGNSYVAHILRLIEDNPTNLIWLCDYAEDPTYNWGTVDEIPTEKSEYDLRFRGESGFIMNHTTKEYISLRAYKKLNDLRTQGEWAISPLSILTNSEDGAMGGGDYRGASERGAWCNHLISYSKKLGEFKDFTDVTEESLVTE